MRHLALPALLAPLALASLLAAQAGERRMFAVREGAGPRSVVSFNAPDFTALREPDFTRRDIQTMDRVLRLDEVERTIVSTLHEGYLAAFEKAAKELLPAGAEGPMGFNLAGGAVRLGPPGGGAAAGKAGGPGPNQPGDGHPMAITVGGAELGEAIREAMREAGQDGPVRIGLAITAGGPGPGGEAPGDDEPGGDGWVEGGGGDVVVGGGGADGPDAGGAAGAPGAPRVAVSIDTGDQPLSDDARAKLEVLAKKLSEQAQQRAAEAVGNGGVFAIPGGASGAAPEDIDAMKARMAEMAKKAEQFAREKSALRDKFVADVKVNLTADQLDRWPGFDRQLTREKTLPKGRLDGEKTDLVRIVDDQPLDAPQREALAPVMLEYEESLHASLVQRNQALVDAQPQIDAAINAGETQKALSMADRVAALRLAVRSVNERFVEAIADKLGGEDATKFRDAAMRDAYPRVYRVTAAQKAFAAARKLDGLSDDLRLAIDQQEQAYQPQLAAANDVIRSAIRESQPGEPHRSIEQMADMAGPLGPGHGDFGPGSSAPDPVRDAMKRRTDLDERTMKQLYAMFTPDQVKTLPKLPSQRRSGPIIFRAAPMEPPAAPAAPARPASPAPTTG